MSAQVMPAKEAVETPAKRARLDSPQPETAEKALTPEHIFKNLRLRRIVRENHNSTVAQIALMFYRPGDTGLAGHGAGGMSAYERSFEKRGSAIRDPDDNSNLLVSAGHNQASVYDNENCGDHLDIMSHFQLPGEHAFRSCCWVRAADQDAVFAAAGDDKLVHLISLAWTREIRVLRGHSEAIVDLQPHPTEPRLLLSVGNDQTVRIWSVLSGQCLCIYNYNGSAARFSPDGLSVFVGSATGEVRQWPVPKLPESRQEPLVFSTSDSNLVAAAKRGIGAAIDCLRFANSNLLVKSMAGRIDYYELPSNTVIRSFAVRNHGVSVSRFDVSYDDKYLCVGNSRGEVYIFSIESGKSVRRLAHKRSVRPVTCSLFTRDCRSVVYTGEGGFIWRYDYVDDETLAEWEKPDDSASNEELSE
ncbi:hypothetical protein LPJ79_002068 [Coemansia sp. RSA 1821]|nr:hypothetical protein LPJ79_002068 [Coemansia sp. RSA 1821]